MSTEKQKIEKTVKEFSALMNNRLQSKRRKGFSGWTDPIMRRDLETRLLNKMAKVIRSVATQEDYVDIANIAMMLDGIHEQFFIPFE